MSVFTNPATGATGNAAAYISAVLELLGDREPSAVLRDTPSLLERAVDGLTSTQLRQPERQGKWSIVQVLQHLADSEVVWAVAHAPHSGSRTTDADRLRPGPVGRAAPLRADRFCGGTRIVRGPAARQSTAHRESRRQLNSRGSGFMRSAAKRASSTCAGFMPGMICCTCAKSRVSGGRSRGARDRMDRCLRSDVSLHRAAPFAVFS